MRFGVGGRSEGRGIRAIVTPAGIQWREPGNQRNQRMSNQWPRRASGREQSRVGG